MLVHVLLILSRSLPIVYSRFSCVWTVAHTRSITQTVPLTPKARVSPVLCVFFTTTGRSGYFYLKPTSEPNARWSGRGGSGVWATVWECESGNVNHPDSRHINCAWSRVSGHRMCCSNTDRVCVNQSCSQEGHGVSLGVREDAPLVCLCVWGQCVYAEVIYNAPDLLL